MAVEALTEWTIVADEVFVFYGDGGEFRGEQVERWLQELPASGVRKYIGATGLSFQMTGDVRKRCNAVLKTQQIKFATITDSALVRGFTTAASWFGIDIAAFAWKDLEPATRWLKLENAVAQEALACVHRHRSAVSQKLAAREVRSARR
ncbi:MAG: hypothetical protein ABW321_13730 [Polyangiales bacterium]